MRLEQLYHQQELRAIFAENYCHDKPETRTIIDRAMNLGLTAKEIDTLLSAAHTSGMEDAQ